MGISNKDLKLLCGRSRNLCAMRKRELAIKAHLQENKQLEKVVA